MRAFGGAPLTGRCGCSQAQAHRSAPACNKKSGQRICPFTHARGRRPPLTTPSPRAARTLLRKGSCRPTDPAPAASHCISAVVSAAVAARSVRPPWGEYPPPEGSARRSLRLAAAGSRIFQVCAEHVPVPGRGAPQGVYPPSASPCAPESPLCPSVRPVPAPAVCVPAKCLYAAICG
jgi:hypothetical protein|eukprot:COSAG01_NODE_464_length_16617_cov_126.274428_9_plen_177_part_00